VTDSKEPLSALPAVRAAALIAAGEISPVELLESCIEQIERVNPIVNAIVTTAFDAAREKAQQAERAVPAGRNAQGRNPLGPLHGLPIAIKDNQLTAGIRTTFGTKSREQFVPDTDAGIVARVRAAGGIPIGKTNIPEMSIGANTVNPVFGATGNPFNPDFTCGGSSGGSAVAVASNMVPLATGSDHGGSLRIPASYCGVVGFRATPGTVPNEERTITQTYYSVQGPIARTVEDAALLLSAITSRDALPKNAPHDPMAFPLNASQFARLDDIDLGNLNVALTADLGGVLVSEQNRALFADRMAALSALFKNCDWHDIDLTDAPSVDWAVRQDIFVTQYSDVAADWSDDFNPNVRATYDSAIKTDMQDIAKARRKQTELFHRMDALFNDYDLLILPGVSIPPFPWKQLNPQEIDGKPVENYMAWLALTSSLTVVGHPVVTLPCGLDAQGTPFGIQLVARTYTDHRLLSMARAVEHAMATLPALTALRRPVAELVTP